MVSRATDVLEVGALTANMPDAASVVHYLLTWLLRARLSGQVWNRRRKLACEGFSASRTDAADTSPAAERHWSGESQHTYQECCGCGFCGPSLTCHRPLSVSRRRVPGPGWVGLGLMAGASCSHRDGAQRMYEEGARQHTCSVWSQQATTSQTNIAARWRAENARR